MTPRTILLGWSALWLIPALLFAATDDTTHGSDVLRFRNGDRLHGTFLSAAPETGIRWQNPEAKNIISFAPDNILDITLAARPSPPEQPSHRAAVVLTNGDRLAGDLTQLSEDTLQLNTWYAGALTIKRPMVQSIRPGGAVRDVLYSGPTGFDGWTRTDDQRAWKYKAGTFYGIGNGGIGRDVKLPDVASLEFDVAWQGNLFLMAGFYCDDLAQLYNGNCYALQINGTSVYLQRGRRGEGFNNFEGGVELPQLRGKTRAHFAVRVNKPEKTISLLLGGEMVKQWTEPGEFAGKGNGILFYSQRQGLMKVSQITVAAWDGKLPTSQSAQKSDEDRVSLVNGDKLSGSLKAITGNDVIFVTSFATMKIPLERVANIELAESKAERARRRDTDVCARFADDNRVTVALEKADEKGLVGTSENFGRVTVKLGAVQQLQFQLYDPRRPANEETDDEFDIGDLAAPNDIVY